MKSEVRLVGGPRDGDVITIGDDMDFVRYPLVSPPPVEIQDTTYRIPMMLYRRTSAHEFRFEGTNE